MTNYLLNCTVSGFPLLLLFLSNETRCGAMTFQLDSNTKGTIMEKVVK